MKFLLDTHVWIWSLLEPIKLNATVQAVLTQPNNLLFLSPISVWETLILIEKKRIQVHTTPVLWVEMALRNSRIQEIALTHAIAVRSRQLLLPHQDPADRFIAATAVEHSLTLITADNLLLNSSQVIVLSAQ
ncbi:MAG: type II toxin-antitoxin system VapC family toxin [Caldilineaceae bacterium]|jgi:PIN domain nuclease of toxin-antitoxin system